MACTEIIAKRLHLCIPKSTSFGAFLVCAILLILRLLLNGQSERSEQSEVVEVVHPVHRYFK